MKITGKRVHFTMNNHHIMIFLVHISQYLAFFMVLDNIIEEAYLTQSICNMTLLHMRENRELFSSFFIFNQSNSK